MKDYKILFRNVQLEPTETNSYLFGAAEFIIIPNSIDDRTTAPEVFCELLKGTPLTLAEKVEEEDDEEEPNICVWGRDDE